MTRSYRASRVPRPASHDRSSSTSRESSGTFRAREFEPELHSAHARDINTGIAGIVRLNPLGFVLQVEASKRFGEQCSSFSLPRKADALAVQNKAESHESMKLKERKI